MKSNLEKISEFTQISANFEDYWVIFSWSMKSLDINFVHFSELKQNQFLSFPLKINQFYR